MTTQPEALRLAERLLQHAAQVRDSNGATVYVMLTMAEVSEAAAELRRLHAENQRLAAEVTNRNRRALEGDEAVAALANVHTHYEAQEKTKDALLRQALEALELFCQYGTIDRPIQRRDALRERLEGKVQ